MQQVLRCGTIGRHYNGAFISSDLIGQKFLNDSHVLEIFLKFSIYKFYFFSIFITKINHVNVKLFFTKVIIFAGVLASVDPEGVFF